MKKYSLFILVAVVVVLLSSCTSKRELKIIHTHTYEENVFTERNEFVGFSFDYFEGYEFKGLYTDPLFNDLYMDASQVQLYGFPISIGSSESDDDGYDSTLKLVSISSNEEPEERSELIMLMSNGFQGFIHVPDETLTLYARWEAIDVTLYEIAETENVDHKTVFGNDVVVMYTDTDIYTHVLFNKVSRYDDIGFMEHGLELVLLDEETIESVDFMGNTMVVYTSENDFIFIYVDDTKEIQQKRVSSPIEQTEIRKVVTNDNSIAVLSSTGLLYVFWSNDNNVFGENITLNQTNFTLLDLNERIVDDVYLTNQYLLTVEHEFMFVTGTIQTSETDATYYYMKNIAESSQLLNAELLHSSSGNTLLIYEENGTLYEFTQIGNETEEDELVIGTTQKEAVIDVETGEFENITSEIPDTLDAIIIDGENIYYLEPDGTLHFKDSSESVFYSEDHGDIVQVGMVDFTFRILYEDGFISLQNMSFISSTSFDSIAFVFSGSTVNTKFDYDIYGLKFIISDETNYKYWDIPKNTSDNWYYDSLYEFEYVEEQLRGDVYLYIKPIDD